MKTRLLFASLTLAIAISGTARAEDTAARKQPAEATAISYDQAVACQALYVVLGARYEESQDYFAGFYRFWYEFHAQYYPTDFDRYHDEDVDAEVDRLRAELSGAADDAARDAAFERNVDVCTRLMDAHEGDEV